jgi:hypothetical protein
LGCAGGGLVPFAEFSHDPGFEERLDQCEHPLVLHPRSHPVHQSRVVDTVEARLDVRVQHPPVTGGGQMMDLGDGVVRAPVRPEPIRARPEIGLEDGFQDQLQRRLDHAVRDGWYPEPA